MPRLRRIIALVRLDKPARFAYRALRKVKRMMGFLPPLPAHAGEEIERINRHCDAQWKECRQEDVITVVVHGDMPYLRETLASLGEQTHKAWKLCVLGLGGRKACQSLMRTGWKRRMFTARALEKVGTPVLYITQPVTLLPEALHHFCSAFHQGADAVYADTYMNRKSGVMNAGPILRPDYAPDYLRGTNYMGGVMAFSGKAAAQMRLLRLKTGFGRAYDAALQGGGPWHIRLILHQDLGFTPDGRTRREGRRALKASIAHMGWDGAVLAGRWPDTFRVQQRLKGQPLISIVIPNKDHIADLSRCAQALKRSTYPRFEVIVVENNSVDPATFAYYEEIAEDPRFHLCYFKGDGVFSYSKLNNFGVRQAAGDYIVLMNNDVEAISADWMETMLGIAQREDVGAVGAKLLYPDNTVQHGGIVLLDTGLAAHAHRYVASGNPGYGGRLCTDQNYNGVTGACLMMRRSVFEEVDGFTEALLEDYTDVDLCLKIRACGYRVVWAADAVLYHYESMTRGGWDTRESQARYLAEVGYYQQHWHEYYERGDAYYSTAFKLGDRTFEVDWERLV